MFEIYTSSKKALANVRTYTRPDDNAQTVIDGRTKYPFRSLAIGQSFAVFFEQVGETNIRNQAYLSSKRLNKKFIVIKHHDLELYEVARIW